MSRSRVEIHLKQCENCSSLMLRKPSKRDILESPSSYHRRRFCSRKCFTSQQTGENLIQYQRENGGATKGMAPWNKGILWKERCGEGHHWWKGGVTPMNKKIRSSRKMVNWRMAVFERDKYTCILCNRRSEKGKRLELNADHIKPFALFPELRFELNNGRTLCVECHRKTPTWGVKINSYKITI